MQPAPPSPPPAIEKGRFGRAFLAIAVVAGVVSGLLVFVFVVSCAVCEPPATANPTATFGQGGWVHGNLDLPVLTVSSDNVALAALHFVISGSNGSIYYDGPAGEQYVAPGVTTEVSLHDAAPAGKLNPGDRILIATYEAPDVYGSPLSYASLQVTVGANILGMVTLPVSQQ